MIPKKDQYVDKDDKITDDPAKYAAQIAVAGVYLDDRVARKYGIEDVLVSVDEPNASRRVTFTGTKPNAKSEVKETEPEAEKPEAAEAAADDAEAASLIVEKPKANKAKKPAKKGEKKK